VFEKHTRIMRHALKHGCSAMKDVEMFEVYQRYCISMPNNIIGDKMLHKCKITPVYALCIER
jgi:hypothetical protein